MRIDKTSTGLAIIALVAITATGPASARPDRPEPPRPCTASWELVDTPRLPGSPEDPHRKGYPSQVHAFSPDDVMFTGPFADLHPWILRWDGAEVRQSELMPPIPLTAYNVQDDARSSFDSASSGWMLSAPITERGGDLTTQRWHGGRWAMTPLALSPDPATTTIQLLDVASVSPTDAWAVGVYSRGGSRLGAPIQHWDGTEWSIVPHPADERDGAVLRRVTALSPSDIWAVGTQSDSNGSPIPLIEHWDGDAWHIIDTPTPPDADSRLRLNGVGGSGPDDVWATGKTDSYTPLIMHWDGSVWTVVDDLPDLEIWSSVGISDVYAASPSDVWFTGAYAPDEYEPGSLNTTPVFLHWDGATWTTTPAPGPKGFDLRFAYRGIDGTGPDDVWAVGFISRLASGEPGLRPQIAHLSCDQRGRR